MTRQATEIRVYWDDQDRGNEGWAYRLIDADGDIESGAIDAPAEDLDAAIVEAVRLADVDLGVLDFARETVAEGGYAIWASNDCGNGSYKFTTDSETGTIDAANFADACDQLHDIIPVSAVENGATGWVEDHDGDRYEIS